MNRALRETLVAFADAHRLRPDWHEPDEAGVMAWLHGDHLDNAYGDEPSPLVVGKRRYPGEYVVEVTGPHGRVSVNLANLLADYCDLVRAVTGDQVALLEAARFSLSVHKAQGLFDLSERMAVEKLEAALG